MEAKDIREAKDKIRNKLKSKKMSKYESLNNFIRVRVTVESKVVSHTHQPNIAYSTAVMLLKSNSSGLETYLQESHNKGY